MGMSTRLTFPSLWSRGGILFYLDSVCHHFALFSCTSWRVNEYLICLSALDNLTRAEEGFVEDKPASPADAKAFPTASQASTVPAEDLSQTEQNWMDENQKKPDNQLNGSQLYQNHQGGHGSRGFTPPPPPAKPKEIKLEDIPDQLKTPEQMEEGEAIVFITSRRAIG